MATLKTTALILKASPYREHDKLLTLFTADRGKIQCVCKKSRHTFNRWASSFEPPLLCNIQLIERNQYYTLTEISVLDAFVKISSSLKNVLALQCVSYIIERFTVQEMESIPLFYLLVSVLAVLNRKQCSARFASSYFSLQFLKESGFALNFSHCGRCETQYQGIDFSFSLLQNTFYCQHCTAQEKVFPTFHKDLLKQVEELYYFPLDELEKNTVRDSLFNYTQIDRILKEMYKGFFTTECLTVSQFDSY